MAKAITIEVNRKELFKSKLSADLEDSLRECTDALDEIEHVRTKLVKALDPNYDWMEHTMDFFWECEPSPSGFCVYHFTDIPRDSCIYCHQPSERK